MACVGLVALARVIEASGVFLTEGELAMAAKCSPRRVLNRLGKASRYFPAPYWSDPQRQPIYTVEDVSKSLLARLEHASVSGATATLRGTVMHLAIPDAFAKVLADRTESHTASAIFAGREPGVAAALVWSPGQTEPEAIFAEGPEPIGFAATFVVVVPNDAERDDIRFMEDGYVAMLSKESAQRLVIALRAATPVDLHGEDRTLRIAIGRSN